MACDGPIGLGDDIDDVENVDTAEGGKIFAAEEGCADDNELLTFLGQVLGGCEGHGFDTKDCFSGVEVVSEEYVSIRLEVSQKPLYSLTDQW